MTTYLVSELEGEQLDAAVALAEGRLVTRDEPRWPKGDYGRLRAEFGGRHVVRWYACEGENCDGPETDEVGGCEPIDNWGSPSTDWSCGGRIIERERISVSGNDSTRWHALTQLRPVRDANDAPCWSGEGPTFLIAAMRAYVASKCGRVVELP